jgi:hypothetical protein
MSFGLMVRVDGSGWGFGSTLAVGVFWVWVGHETCHVVVVQLRDEVPVRFGQRTRASLSRAQFERQWATSLSSPQCQRTFPKPQNMVQDVHRQNKMIDDISSLFFDKVVDL